MPGLKEKVTPLFVQVMLILTVLVVAKILFCGFFSDYQWNDVECPCLVPCKRVTYRPNLSSTPLDGYTIGNYVIKSGHEKRKLKVRFHLSMQESYLCQRAVMGL